MEKIVVIGAGESGVGTAILAKKKGYDVMVSDYGTIAPKYKEELNAHQIKWEESGHSETLLDGVSLVIKSPGIPNTSNIVCQIIERQIPIESEIEFAGRFYQGKSICITGSNGKTTTTSLIYHILKNAGVNVGVGGNIGISFARQIAEKDFDWFVLELSSFQLEDMHRFKAEISILLNITPDHLDRYEYQLSKYIDAKFRVIQNQEAEDLFIYFGEDKNITDRLETMTLNVEKFSFGLEQEAQENAGYLEDHNINVQLKGNTLSLPISTLPLKGKHNWLNVMASVGACMQMGLSSSAIEEGVRSFASVAHRLELCRTLDGVKYINDSKATNIDATKYALDAFEQPIVWIVGGKDKGNDYTTLYPLVKQKVKSIVCLGVDNSKIVSAFKDFDLPIVETNKMEDAVRKAKELSTQEDIVLLSPCCASFDLFRSYEDRGDQFKKYVNNL